MERWYHTRSKKFNRYIELKIRTTYPGLKYAICVNGVVKANIETKCQAYQVYNDYAADFDYTL